MLMAGILLALAVPLAERIAQQDQQHVVVDRMDDIARFASLGLYVTSREESEASAEERDRRRALKQELEKYYTVYGIKAGVFYRDRGEMEAAPTWDPTGTPEGARAFDEALASRRSHDPRQVWPWQSRPLTVASPIVRDGDVVAVVVTESPTDKMRRRILVGWLWLAAGIGAAMLVGVAAAFRLTSWVLRPVRILDKATHDIATGRLKSRVAASGGPPELQRLTRSFNEMADNVEDVLEQQRAFVADASHQLRNPLAALLLRIELLKLELPEGNEEIASVQAEGKRLAEVLDDLLGLALAEHATVTPRLTDVAALVDERMAAWGPLAAEKGVGLERAGNGAVTGWADAVGLSSALDAVIDNALKFTPSGGTVQVAVAARGDEVTVGVADGGPGLTEEELARVGDRFWRSGRHQNVKGSGLGLSIARSLLAAGGGRIAFTANEPRGLRVTVTVPRTEPAGD